ncbi:MAG: type II secretion system GspH family protein [Verrucomicrobia bacterium]|nr:type II secretion system GspH family protein [Verrucomicrobiota bacterium]MBU4247800.1 type II secretion system GspH family protein [Verrucomicrobiota bacterium]MBU4292088.1 type II secretion system GspH family protein [Verrucomicrobiota bacterium]MBU4497678.1 type II secretion system GspH family protein [Verrucomicrobiota bacterium]MCG2681020.1 type II secretion system GspH family protein [Kiritimatiellia bacterium]
MKKGFTLVEVVIAIALLIISLSLFVGAFVQAKRSAVISDNRMEAVHTARIAMETLLSSVYGSTLLSNGLHLTSSAPNVSYFVATITQTPGIVVKNIYMTNSWTNAGMKMKSTVSLVGSLSSELHQ